jgi:uncharacterized protein YqcC (DUF446 family)
MNPYEQAELYADRIELELRRIGAWQSEPPPPEAFESRTAFFGDTMSFYQWLQFVLLDRIRSITDSQGSFPRSSQVAAYAVRELDGVNEAAWLVQLLCQFDRFIDELNEKPAPGGASAAHCSDPTEVAAQFLAAVRNRDANAVRGLLSAVSRGFSISYEAESGVTGAEYLAGGPESDGDGCLVRCAVMVRFDGRRQEERTLILRFVNEDGRWKIDLAGTYERTIAALCARNEALTAEMVAAGQKGDIAKMHELIAQMTPIAEQVEQGLGGVGLSSAWLSEVAADVEEASDDDNGEGEETARDEDDELDAAELPPDYYKEIVATYWRKRRVGAAADLETPEPWPAGGSDVSLAERVVETAGMFQDTCHDVEPFESGVIVDAIVDAERGAWLVRTVLRQVRGEWLVDPVLTIERTASMYLRQHHIHPPFTHEDTARGRAMEFWHQVARHDARRAAELLTPDTRSIAPPKKGQGYVDEFFWYIDDSEQDDGSVLVRVLMNTQEEQRWLYTRMIQVDGEWMVDLAATLQYCGF